MKILTLAREYHATSCRMMAADILRSLRREGVTNEELRPEVEQWHKDARYGNESSGYQPIWSRFKSDEG